VRLSHSPACRCRLRYKAYLQPLISTESLIGFLGEAQFRKRCGNDVPSLCRATACLRGVGDVKYHVFYEAKISESHRKTGIAKEDHSCNRQKGRDRLMRMVARVDEEPKQGWTGL